MLQTARAERIPARRPYPRLPVSAHWDIQRESPTFYFVDVPDLTGRYERESGAFAFYDRLLASLCQATYQGTGGEPLWAEAMQSLASASGAYIVVQSPPRTTPPVDPAAVTPVDVGRQLAFARHYLSLNTTDLSRILLVERPTVYAWLDGKWDPKQENKGRIRKLYQVARTWHDMSKQPMGKLLREPIEGDTSLMDYLVRDILEIAAINRILMPIRELADRKVKAKRVRSVREVAKQRGFKPLSSAQESERFDRITRF
jgi:hypothetical protein